MIYKFMQKVGIMPKICNYAISLSRIKNQHLQAPHIVKMSKDYTERKIVCAMPPNLMLIMRAAAKLQ